MFTRRLLAFSPRVRSMAAPTPSNSNSNLNLNLNLGNVNVNGNVGPRERLIRAKVSPA